MRTIRLRSGFQTVTTKLPNVIGSPEGIQKENEYNTADKGKGSTKIGERWDDNIIGQWVGRGNIGERWDVEKQWVGRGNIGKGKR